MDVQTTTETILMVELKAQMNDNGYIIRVFECLEEYYNHSKYIMCTQFPGWHQKHIEIGELGYLKIREIIAGKTGWYDEASDKLVAYNYDNIQFIKFVSKNDDIDELYTDNVIPIVSSLKD